MAQRQFGRIIRAAQWESFKGMVWKGYPVFSGALALKTRYVLHQLRRVGRPVSDVSAG